MLLSDTSRPRRQHSSNTTRRVTPLSTPAAKGGVKTFSRTTQNRFADAASTTNPSVFSNRASSAPSCSASARASTCASLLQVLYCETGSAAGSLKLDVRKCQSTSVPDAFPSAVCSVITTNGEVACLGE